MVSRLLLAGACALGLATAATGTASADLPGTAPDPSTADVTLYVPAAVQVWSPSGLALTIRCLKVTTHPACDPGQWPQNTDVLVKEKGGYRFLARSGRWFELGGTDAAVAAMERDDATGGPGAAEIVRDPSELDAWDPRRAAAAGKRAAKKAGKRAKQRGAVAAR
jgi:hypothetical protein